MIYHTQWEADQARDIAIAARVDRDIVLCRKTCVCGAIVQAQAVCLSEAKAKAGAEWKEHRQDAHGERV